MGAPSRWSVSSALGTAPAQTLARGRNASWDSEATGGSGVCDHQHCQCSGTAAGGGAMAFWAVLQPYEASHARRVPMIRSRAVRTLASSLQSWYCGFGLGDSARALALADCGSSRTHTVNSVPCLSSLRKGQFRTRCFTVPSLCLHLRPNTSRERERCSAIIKYVTSHKNCTDNASLRLVREPTTSVQKSVVILVPHVRC
jgi:hypothetical protein